MVPVTAFLAACSGKPLDTTAGDSPVAQDINWLFWLVMSIAGVVFVLVIGGVLFMSIRGRVKPGDDGMYPDEDFPAQTHGNTRLEIGWTIVPALIMATIAVATLSTLFKLDDVSARPNDRIHHITVVGQQWWWEFHYYLESNPDEVAFVTADEVVIPTGEEIVLEVTSRDVIHSFWIPRLNGKRDAVPGRVNPWTLEATNDGRYLGQCTEFCGLSHAYMRMYTVAIPLDEWDQWAANQVEPQPMLDESDPNFAGQQEFLTNCASCHSISGVTDTNGDGSPDDWSMYGFQGEPLPDLQKRIIPSETQQVAGAAPNMTHFASRISYAGSMFYLYENGVDLPVEEYATIAETGTVDRGQLEAWIRNAPAEKGNAWDGQTGQRGMTPFLGLTDDQMDQIVDYLLTLD